MSNTRLMIACQKNDIKKIEELLANDVDVLQLNHNKQNALMMVKSFDAFYLIAMAAEEKGCWEKLLSLEDIRGNNAIFYACGNGQPEIIAYLIRNQPNLPEIISPKKLLSFARMATWSHPEKGKEFHQICLALRSMISANKVPEFDSSAQVSSSDAYFTLFSKSKPRFTFTSKKKAIKNAVAQHYALLNSPTKCIKYFKFLNKEFKRYYQVKYKQDFPKLDPNSYEFKIIDGTYYPIPKQEYVGLKEHRVLQEFLLALFRGEKHGLGEKAFKLIGFIPEITINAMIANGDFLVENQDGIGLTHTKYGHMLQIALMLCALDKKEIQARYVTKRGIKEINAKDILQFLVTKKIEDDFLWLEVHDTRNFTEISFSDPYRISSFLMHQGSSIKTLALSDYLIDTFCKGFKGFLTAHNTIITSMKMDEPTFSESLNDLKSSAFFTPSNLFYYSVNKENKKGSKVTASNFDSKFLVVEKDYVPDPNFKPKRFGQC